jgi:hypothetical protein
MRALGIALLTACFLAAPTPATAKEVRLSVDGAPAITFDAPDGWTTQRTSRGGFGLISDDKSATFTVTFGRNRLPLDVAAGMLPAASGGSVSSFQRVSEIEVSGRAGVLYSGQTQLGALTISLKFHLIRIDEENVVSIVQSTPSFATPEAIATADGVMKSVRISP